MMLSRVPVDIESYHFDVIVIGAGINGAGIARDAALRNLNVLLLDKGDIGSGTTSYPTRLIHGGLRYLEYFEIPLVRESLREREILLRTAPHLVKPLAFLIPIYRGGKRGPLLIRAGMIAYDALSFDKSLEHHHMLSRKEALELEPGLNPEGLRGAALYYDAQVEYPERLTLEVALGARRNGALVLSYAAMDRLILRDNAVRGVHFTDVLSGKQYTAFGSVTINAAGPWVDRVLAAQAGLPVRPMLGGTKGSHIVVAAFPGAPREALYVEARANGRPYFIVPWNDLYLIGTTDLRFAGDLDRVVADEPEIDYLLAETDHVIPAASLTRESVLYSYAGVRPLPYQEEGSEGSITRRHIIHDHAPATQGLISIIGGKLSTYRSLAEQAVDLVFRKLGQRPPRSHTAQLPLPGAETSDYPRFAREFQTDSGLPEAVARQLLLVYGTRADEVLQCAGGNQRLLAPFGDTNAIGAEIPFSFEAEMAHTLTDVLMRRTMVGWGPRVGVGADQAAAEVAVQYLGWDRVRVEEEVGAYRRFIERYKPRVLTRV